MAERVVSLGNPLGIQFEIRWPERRSTRSAESATYGELLLWIHENLVWGATEKDGGETAVAWSWVELLEFLSNAWPYLLYESGYPLGLRPIWPARLRDEAEARWQTVPEDIGREEEEELFAFEETHDLARGVHGLFAPSVWFVREGGLMTIGSRRTTIRRPREETIDTLERFGEEIRARIANLDDEHSKSAVRGWDDRLSLDPWSLAEIATHWPEDELRSAAEPDDPWQAFEIEGDKFYVTEPLEIAGLTRGFLGVEQLKGIFSLLRSVGHIDTPELDSLSAEAGDLLGDDADGRPYNQGYRLANWLRDKPGVAKTDGRVDVDSLILSLGVHVGEVDLANNLLDALACWGPRHGPAVWINRNEKHGKVEGARRSTLAHELCHLLVDREGALPLADVINGNAPRWVEQRADAFAAELLLPRHLATAEFSSNTDIDTYVGQLTNQYGVSRELTAWQIRNSGIPLSPADYAKLRAMVSSPERF